MDSRWLCPACAMMVYTPESQGAMTFYQIQSAVTCAFFASILCAVAAYALLMHVNSNSTLVRRLRQIPGVAVIGITSFLGSIVVASLIVAIVLLIVGIRIEGHRLAQFTDKEMLQYGWAIEYLQGRTRLSDESSDCRSGKMLIVECSDDGRGVLFDRLMVARGLESLVAKDITEVDDIVLVEYSRKMINPARGYSGGKYQGSARVMVIQARTRKVIAEATLLGPLPDPKVIPQLGSGHPRPDCTAVKDGAIIDFLTGLPVIPPATMDQ